MDDKQPLLDMPAELEVSKGCTYLWCSCGKSETQPLCDRTDCGYKAIKIEASLSETLYLCNCKLTKNPPFCDGSHAEILRDRIKNRQNR